MNKARILALAEEIREPQNGVGFNMETFYSTSLDLKDNTGHGCGTVACMAGHILMKTGKLSLLEGKDNVTHRAVSEAGLWLGLGYPDAYHLFMGYLPGMRHLFLRNITPAQAAETLTKLVETGKVDWSHVPERVD